MRIDSSLLGEYLRVEILLCKTDHPNIVVTYFADTLKKSTRQLGNEPA